MLKMLDVLTINTVNQIFNTSTKIKPLSKILYISCLTKHFEQLDATEENSVAFEIKKSEMSNYGKWIKEFENLEAAGLLQIHKDSVFFENKWGQLIDRSRLNFQSTIQALKTASDYEVELTQNTSMIDVIGMKNKISKKQVLKLIKMFVLEQEATQTKHKDIGECSKHFIYWVNNNLDKVDNRNESVKSTAKILGRDAK
jgi:hypothetical protein